MLHESLERFGVLATPQEAPDGRSLRMSELAGRAVRAHITDEGDELMSSIARSHHALVRQMYLDHLTDAEQCQLGALWRRMLD